jgi:prophage regulatory protein
VPPWVLTLMRKLLKIRDVLDRIPVSRAHIYNLMKEGKFPRQIHLGGTGAFWVETEVEAWIQSHIDAADERIGVRIPIKGQRDAA